MMPVSTNIKQMFAGLYRSVLKVVGGHGLGRIYPLNRLNAWFTRHVLLRLRSNTAIVHGHTMLLDPKDSLGLSLWGTWEPFETELILKLSQRGDVVVDIGANIGYYTLLLARRVGPEGHVFAFEPAPANVALLKENIRGNGYANVTVEPQAVSDQTGAAVLSLSSENQGDHRLNRSGTTATVTVPTVTMDDYFRQHTETIHLVKMDIQGAELRALRGMRELISRQSRWILILEFFPSALEQMGDDPESMLAFLREAGFSMHEIVEATHRLAPIPLEWYSRNRFGTEGFTNLLCVRGDTGIEM